MKKLILILILLSIPIFSQNKLLYTNAGKALISDTADVVRAEFKAVDDSLGNLISLIKASLTDLEGDTLSYTVNEIDSLLALAATALQDVAITFPDQNTIKD